MQMYFRTSDKIGLLNCSVERKSFEDTNLTIEVRYTIRHKDTIIGETPSLEIAKAIVKDYIKTGQAY